MSIDQLHNRIRKLKNPSMVSFEINPNDLPPHLLEQEGTIPKSYERFCHELLNELKDAVPAVRFSSSIFFMMGEMGCEILSNLLREAKDLGYYVVLDAPEILSPLSAEFTAGALDSNNNCDAMIVSPYIGSDALKPFLPVCKSRENALFAVVRSPNKSASELQDLQFGTRQAHVATADIISRHGESMVGKCGYSQIGALVSAGNPDVLRSLRMKYPRCFFLVDGIDYPSGNSKNCSFAFDKFGYGAIVCAGTSVTAAWKETESNGQDYLLHAVRSVDKLKRNLTRYVSVL
ncbi:MAG: hypothetical protein J6Q30_05950 [Oscillospiraceae bacterium]|nr:hypothetical protein [Oscillospiraceae bacterium]